MKYMNKYVSVQNMNDIGLEVLEKQGGDLHDTRLDLISVKKLATHK